METVNSEFFAYSKDIASRFLMSAIVVDDMASFEKPDVDITPKHLVAPSIATITEGISTNGPDSGVSFDSHGLNAKEITDSFAKKGIFCSILKPYKRDLPDIKKMTKALSVRSDVIIVDWVILKEREPGQNALAILKDISRDSAQLHLVIIYTGAPELLEISQKIKTMLGQKAKVEDEGLTLIKGSIRICIYAKPDTKVIESHKNRILLYENLTEKVIEEFTKMTSGLVSNVALDSISQIRRNTPKVLETFSRELDPPYLTHRALQPDPADAEHHLTSWVTQELNAVIEEAAVSQHVKMEAIEKWIKSRSPFKLSGKELDVTTLLRVGINDFPALSNKQKNNAHKNLTNVFAGGASSPNADEKLARLSTIRSFYQAPMPYLTQGTIVERLDPKGNESSHYVCVQPRCDCVRLTTKRKFLFLPLKRVRDDGKFNMVIFHDDKFDRYFYEKDPYNLHIEAFKPLKSQNRITFKKDSSGNYILTITKSKKFKWLAELRWDHSQRLSNELSGNLARVGLDESEWLRRSAK